MIKFQYISDLHLELYKDKKKKYPIIKKTADNLYL